MVPHCPIVPRRMHPIHPPERPQIIWCLIAIQNEYLTWCSEYQSRTWSAAGFLVHPCLYERWVWHHLEIDNRFTRVELMKMRYNSVPPWSLNTLWISLLHFKSRISSVLSLFRWITMYSFLFLFSSLHSTGTMTIFLQTRSRAFVAGNKRIQYNAKHQCRFLGPDQDIRRPFFFQDVFLHSRCIEL